MCESVVPHSSTCKALFFFSWRYYKPVINHHNHHHHHHYYYYLNVKNNKQQEEDEEEQQWNGGTALINERALKYEEIKLLRKEHKLFEWFPACQDENRNQLKWNILVKS